MLLQEGMTVRVCLLPDGDDPDSFARKHTAEEYRQFITEHATDYIHFKANLLLREAGDDPLKRGEVIRDITKVIAIIPEAIMRDVFIKEAADLLGIEEKRMVGYVATQRDTDRKAAANKPAVSQPQSQPQSQPATMSAPPEEAPVDESMAGDVTPSLEAHTPLPTADVQRSAVNGKWAKELYQYEHIIMQLVVRYGEKTMCDVTDDDGNVKPLSVIDFVNYTLAMDELELANAIFRKMLEDAVSHQHDIGFVSEKFFVNHPDADISKMALDLVSDRYQLSKYHSKTQTIVTDDQRLKDLGTEITTSYKYAFVNEQMKEVMRQMQDPVITNDPVKCAQAIQRYTELREVLSNLAKLLGERVILSI